VPDTICRVVQSTYARPEREQRWLLRALPDLGHAVDARRIDDHYVFGTRLRVRRVAPLPDGRPQYKLGQKVRPNPTDSRLVMHTSMYLIAGEHERLCRLPGADLHKDRHVLLNDGQRLAIDVFRGRHAGLVLIEVELPGPELIAAPAFAGVEVTGDERFTGGWLAFASDEALAAVLSTPPDGER
jgi:hypothetical protein